MSDRIPPWIVELADKGSLDRLPADVGEEASAERLGRLLRAFGRTIEPGARNGADSGHAFTWGHLKATVLIGNGSFGDVYRAFDTTLEREVALKLRHGDASHARSFITEARRLAQVRHPNVLAVHGAGVHDGRAGLWADLLDGQTVADTVAAGGPLSWPSILTLARELCSALAAVHAAGLVHADVKPSNVMLQADGHIVLMDFGAAAEHAVAARCGVTGSPLSMAPEQLHGNPVGTAADMYSLGVVLFFAASGRYPARAATLSGLQNARRDFDPVSALKGQSSLPRPFRRLLALWLDPDATRRPDASASLRQLGRIADAPARRREHIAVGAVIGSLVLALVVSLFALQRVRTEREAAETARVQQAAVSAFLEDTLAAPDPAESGADVRVAEVLGVAARNAEQRFVGQPATLLPLLRTIGTSYKGLGLDQRAEPLLARALSLSRELHGEDSAEALDLELKLAETQDNQRQRSANDSPAPLEAIFAHAKSSLGPGHRVSVAAALQLAQWHNQRRQADRARPYIDFVLAHRPAAGNLQPAQRATALSELATIEDRHGDDELALAHLQEALQLSLDASSGPDQNVSAIRTGLALLLKDRGDLVGAEQQFRELLALAGYFGESHRNVRVALLNLSAVLNAQHKFDEAEAMMRRCIELSRKYAGDNHQVEFSARNNLAALLVSTGRLAEAGRIREDLRAKVIGALGADDPFAIMLTLNLAEQRILEGNGVAAQPLATETVERSERVLGADHIYAIEGRELQARARFLRGARTAAIADMATVCARKRTVLGEAQQYTLSCMTHRADMLAGIGKFDAAVAILERVVWLTARQLGPDNPGTIDARAHLVAMRDAALR